MVVYNIYIRVNSVSSSQLQDHVDSGASLKVIIRDSHVVCQLFSSENESDLFNGDSFFFLECLFDLENGVVLFKVERLLSSDESLNC